MARLILTLVAVLTFAAANGATAAPQVQFQADQITGFRDARFGDSESQVRAVIARDFHIGPGGVTRQARTVISSVPNL